MQTSRFTLSPERCACYVLLAAVMTFEPINATRAADASGKCEPGHWFATLGQSVPDKSGSSAPASLSYNNPQGADSSYNVDAAISAVGAQSCPQDKFQWDLALTAEDHKNTQVKKELDTRAASVSVIGDYPLGRDDGTGLYDAGLYPVGSLSYKQDRIKHTSSVTVTLKSGIRYNDWGIFHYQNLGKDSNGGRFMWAPDVGLQNERSSTGTNTPSGDISRFYGGVRIEVWPWDHKSQVGLVAKWWYDLARSSGLDTGAKSHNFRNPYVAYRIWEEKDKGSIDLRLDHVNGENPETGLQDQSYTQIGLKFSWKF
jgi:hypothetical protein